MLPLIDSINVEAASPIYADEHNGREAAAKGRIQLSAVYGALERLLPIVQAAPADRKTRRTSGWSGCGSPLARGRSELLPVLREAWSDQERYSDVQGTFVCLSSLLAARRHEELLQVRRAV